ATTDDHTLSLHDALPISRRPRRGYTPWGSPAVEALESHRKNTKQSKEFKSIRIKERKQKHFQKFFNNFLSLNSKEKFLQPTTATPSTPREGRGWVPVGG